MRCLECGYQNQDSASSCLKCGTALSPAPQMETPPAPKAEDTPEDDSAPKTIKQFNDIKPSGAPTLKGKAVDLPAWDEEPEIREPKSEKKHTYFTCNECQYYPLQEPANEKSPCPNCGNMGKAKAQTQGTQKLGDIRLGEASYTLVLKDDKNEVVLEMEDGKTLAYRENLDDKNKSISSEKHAAFSVENGDLYMEDVSSNQATFVQVTGKVKLENGAKIILGNKIYEIRLEEK